jgi:hydrogenase-4 component B
MERHLPTPFDVAPRYKVTIGDHFWYWLYLPLAAVVERAARAVGLMQRGRIGVYLLYSFVTLIALLVWVTW